MPRRPQRSKHNKRKKYVPYLHIRSVYWFVCVLFFFFVGLLYARCVACAMCVLNPNCADLIRPHFKCMTWQKQNEEATARSPIRRHDDVDDEFGGVFMCAYPATTRLYAYPAMLCCVLCVLCLRCLCTNISNISFVMLARIDTYKENREGETSSNTDTHPNNHIYGNTGVPLSHQTPRGACAFDSNNTHSSCRRLVLWPTSGPTMGHDFFPGTLLHRIPHSQHAQYEDGAGGRRWVDASRNC